MKFSESSTVLRVHDPFGSHPKAFKELLKKDSWKHQLARTLRTHAFVRNIGRHTIVANSNFTARQFSQIYDIPEQSIKVIPYGFKTHTFENIMKLREKKSQADSYYLMICGMRGNKRPDVVINEWAIYAERLPKLIVVGKIPDEVLSPLALNLLKSGSLVLMDFADEESLLLLKINANAMIFASEYEGFGRPVIEALVCGVPSIVNDLEVFQEVGAEVIDVFSLDNPISLIPLLEKYTKKIGMDQSISLVEFGQKYSYSQIGEMWREILVN
jgi:glycosyltransferase involved in cell wall biosynthesis